MHVPDRHPIPDSEPPYRTRDSFAPVVYRPPPDEANFSGPPRLIVVDGDSRVRTMFAEVLQRQGNDVTCASSGADAADWLARRQFDVILCDVSLPEVKGTPLHHLVLNQFPDMVLILVMRSGAEDIAGDASIGRGNDRITEKCSPSELAITVQRSLTHRALQHKHAQRFRILLETSRESMLDALLTALNARDSEPQGHAETVTAYTMEIADRMAVPAGQMYHIERGALLHDIGYIGIPDRILRKPDRLTADEVSEIRKHPAIGYQMCSKIEMLKPASQIVLHHHEKWNGSGYPDGLAADAIPRGARMFAVADALDAITTERPFRQARTFSEAREEIVRGSSTHFDPEVVGALMDISESRLTYIRANVAR